MNETALDQLDAAPLKADLARVEAIKTKAEFTRFMAGTQGDYGATLFGLGIIPDPNNPALNTLFVGTGGLGLPDRDYYLLDKHKAERDAYRAYIERTLTMVDTPDAAAAADAILAFETEIAKISWDKNDLRNIEKLNNPMTTAQLAVYAPGIDWAAYLADAKINGAPNLLAADNTAIKALAAMYDKAPLDLL